MYKHSLSSFQFTPPPSPPPRPLPLPPPPPPPCPCHPSSKVHWQEIEGSKLITSKLDIITTSLTMLRDMLCVRVCYSFGIWRVKTSVESPVPKGGGSRKKD